MVLVHAHGGSISHLFTYFDPLPSSRSLRDQSRWANEWVGQLPMPGGLGQSWIV